MNDAHLHRGDREIDLSRLNETERRVLRLLAEGHTAKSIANELGLTPTAVNERLREARRKTEVGSSRELARLLKAQENRHQQLGIGRGSSFGTVHSSPDAEPWRPQTGVLAMIAIFLVAAAGAAALMTQQPSSTVNAPTNSLDNDPLFASILAEPDPTKLLAGEAKNRRDMDRALAGEGFRAVLRKLHARVQSEARDPAWAPDVENALRAAFVSIPNVGVKGTELRVLCASTICEVAGSVEVPPSTAKGEIARFNRATMFRLNPKALEPQTDKVRLKST